MAKFIHNVSGDTLILRGIEVLDGGYYLIPDASLVSWKNDIVINEKLIASELKMSADGVNLIDDAMAGLSLLKGSVQEVDVKTTTPYALPEHRTKRDATAEWKTCPADTTTTDDFQLTAERYVTGGELIYKNAKEGDYITAEVMDIDSIIPSPYRAALCENWPVVAQYVVKKWMVPTEPDKYLTFVLETFPLNAKINAGLYLRITYVATSEAGDRKIAVNYHLTKKL